MDESILKIREQIQKNFKKITGESLFLADWEDTRIAWEGTDFDSLQYFNLDKYHKILDDICPEGYFIEQYNSCEGCICEA